MKPNAIRLTAFGVLLLGVGIARASFEIDWHTIDGGGVTVSTGGAFELSGTIGQPDAGPMVGGAYQWDGGFWPGVISTCTCLGDMNSDGLRNGRDIQKLTQCWIAGGACACADVDGVPGLSIDDISIFVADLLAGSDCP